jgi:hypothetical protein
MRRQELTQTPITDSILEGLELTPQQIFQQAGLPN